MSSSEMYDFIAERFMESDGNTLNQTILYAASVALFQDNEDVLHALAEPWILHPDYDRIFEQERI